jgi:uncharacterized protein YraI
MRRPFRLLTAVLIFSLITVLVGSLSAQDQPMATVGNALNLRAGPGTDQPDIGDLTIGIALVLEGRNDAGDWVLIHTTDNSLRGWVYAPYLTLGESVTVSALPISTETMAAAEYDVLAALRATPIVPNVTARSAEIYQTGLALGNNPNRFSKVGDCQNIQEFFLGSFDRGEYVLGSFGDLQTTIDHFSGSFSRDSMSVSGGFNVYSVLDPSWSPAGCNSGESPQACEYRQWQPSFAIVSLEITSGITAEGYGWALRQVLDFWIENGVVPIVATKADNREGDWSVNATIAQIAWEYDVPLWNFLMATQPLPDYGLTDGFHLTYANNDFSDPAAMQSGWAWRNLTALQTLDVLRRGLVG